MDNAARWWDTQAEAKAEALRKFGESEKQRDRGRQQRKVTAIIGAIFFASLVALYEIVKRVM